MIPPMRAFVLSGGGNRGPLQVGVLKVLLQAGIQPEMVVGTSVGAINGAYLAVEPSLAQMTRNAQLWKDAGPQKLLYTSTSQMLARLVRGRDFFTDNKKLRAYIRQHLPPNINTFGNLALPLFVTISHLITNALYVYGDDPNASIIDAIMLSSAVPGVFPPLIVNDELFTDGGAASNLPMLLAINRGATEIWAIDLAFKPDLKRKVRGGLNIASYPGRPLLYQTMLRELECAVKMPGITVHHLPLYSHDGVRLGDFSKTDEMVAEGERVARAYLDHPTPNQVHYPPPLKADELPEGPAGARPFVIGRRLGIRD
jgi:NTE family protein